MATEREFEGVLSFDIGGYSVSEIARQWLDDFEILLLNTLGYHYEQENDFLDAIKDGVPAEILNTIEQDAWEGIRREFSAFGLDQEAESAVNDFIEDYRQDGTLLQVIQKALAVF